MKTIARLSVLVLSFSLLVAAVYAAEAEAPVVVSIEGSSFSPEVAVIKVGGEVIWKNKDSVPHTVTADDGSFDSGTLAGGGEYKKKFTKAGIVKYSCDVHAYMSGRIEVR